MGPRTEGLPVTLDDAYAALGLVEGCSPDEVKRAYRRAVRRSEGGTDEKARRPLAGTSDVRVANDAVFLIGDHLARHSELRGRVLERPLTSAELDGVLPAKQADSGLGHALDPVLANLLAAAGGLLIGRSAPAGRVPSWFELSVGFLALSAAGYYAFRYARQRR